jgi:GNAT superfamily N-acetyltransferase
MNTVQKIRPAVNKDLPAIVKMIANDQLGQLREDYTEPLPQKYYTAFENITSDRNQELIVAENEKGRIIGTLQLSFLQYLTYQGGIRAQIEAVRVHKNFRGRGIGQQFFHWAISRAKDQGANVVQLTKYKKRPEALKFYEQMGFKPSHEGMKLHL